MNRRAPESPGTLSVAVLIGVLMCLFGLNACDVDQKGMVLMIDTSYRASVLASSQDGFAEPDGILWWRDRLLIADEGGRAMRAWSREHTVETLCDSTLGIKEPEDLVVDRDGNVFFTDDAAGGVWMLDENGKRSLVAGRKQGLFSTEGIVLSPSGEILVGDGVRHEVFRVTRAGKVLLFLDRRFGITKPESMVYDEKGNLYIADNHDQVVYLLTPGMKLRRLIDHRDRFSPETIWYVNHVLYITDSENGKLSTYTEEEGLKTIALFGGELRRVCGVTTDDRGNIYVSVRSDRPRGTGYILKLERESLS